MDWTELRRFLLGEHDPKLLPPKVEIPVLPTTVTEVCKKTTEPDCTSAALATIIERDSALTCEILRYVNSSAIGLRHKASTVQKAIGMLGIQKSRLFLITAALERAMRASQSPLILTKLFCTGALERALFAREVAKLLKVDPDLAFASAMLQDFMLPKLTVELIKEYTLFTDQLLTGQVSLAKLERERFSWDHAECTGRVMLAWGFPDDLICCVRLHEEFETVWNDGRLRTTPIGAVVLSAQLPDILSPNEVGMQRLRDIEATWPAFKLQELANIVAEQLTSLASDLGGYQTLAARLEQQLVTA